ncbi:MAG: hypothetical protein O9294_13765 [Cytophagales bacterium]|jgi:hypothetical protein|nr:hypothetical protein [Cytophagales bacterium]
MVTKALSLFSIIGASFLFWGCPSDCFDAEYNFRLTLAIEPESDTIKVGETIWVTCTFSDMIYAENQQKEVHYPNGKFCFNLGPRKLIDAENEQDKVIDGFPFFEQIIENGEPGSYACTHTADYENNIYTLRVGYKATIPGVYFLRGGFLKATRGSKCGNNDAFVVGSFEESRQNIKIYFDHYGVDYSTIDDYSLSNMFGFVVEE